MNVLSNRQVAETLADLHVKAAEDHEVRRVAREKAAEQGVPFDRGWASAYLAVTAEEGRFLHFLATASRCKKIVEFGCSFGISTIYLAAAAKATGGHVITTDIEPAKIAGAQQNLARAGLIDVVTLLEGNALDTLSAVDGPVDFLFLDGAKDLYLPVFELLKGKLAPNTIIFADNADHKDAEVLVNTLSADTTHYASMLLFGGRAFIATRI